MAGRHARPAPQMEQLRSGFSLPDEAAPAGGALPVMAPPRPVRVTLVVDDPEQADLVAEGLESLGIPVLERDGATFTLYRSGTDR